MKTVMRLITPEMAVELLKKNKINRPPSRRVVEEYARMMAAGLWYEETGEAIKITPDGILVDGQQRLMALVKANVSLSFLMAEVDRDAFKYIDCGKKRTPGDVFVTAGVKNYVGIPAGIRRYLALRGGRVIADPNGAVDGSKLNISNGELLSFYSANPDLFQGAYNMSDRWLDKSGRLLNKADIMGFYLYFRDIDSDDAYEFMCQLFEGANIDAKSPILLLKRRLLEDKINTRYKLSGTIKTALVIKTWNFFRTKATPRVLVYNVNKEDMPVAI